MKDRFSEHADDYARFRPGYPTTLIEYLVSVCNQQHSAWDCATGNGQLAYKIAPYFDQVEASDISAEQLAAAQPLPNINYQESPAERTIYPDHHFDLVVVAQAVHWFDFDLFFKEVKRVLKPAGTFAMLGYGLTTVNDQIDPIVSTLYEEILGPYWDHERRHIEQNYQSIPFPFEEIKVPIFVNEMTWTLDHFISYLNTWSALKRFVKIKNHDPLPKIKDQMERHWTTNTTVRFPIILRAGSN